MKNKLQKMLALVLALAMTLAMAGCASNDGPQTGTQSPDGSQAPSSAPSDSGEPASGEPAKRGLVVASHNPSVDSTFRALYEESLSAAVAQYKEDGVISEYYSYCSNGDTATQSQQIQQCINDGVDIIIVNPISGTGIDAEIEKALDAGITIICADCVYESDKVISIVNDQYSWAAQQAQFMVDTLGAGAKVVMFNGKEGNSASQLRESAYRKVLEEGGIEIVYEGYNDWNDATSYQKMSEVISSGIEYDGILSQIAINGILNALEDNNVPYPKAISGDIAAGAIRRLCQINKDGNDLPFFCVANSPGIGVTALSVAINMAMGNELDESVLDADGNISVTPFWTITNADMDEKLKDLEGMEDTSMVSAWMNVEEAKEAFFR